MASQGVPSGLFQGRRVRERLENWRGTKLWYERILEGLWAAAVKLCDLKRVAGVGAHDVAALAKLFHVPGEHA